MACSGPALCDPEIQVKEVRETCGTPAAWPFFITFIFNCCFLMLNLFIAVIMDNFIFLFQDESLLGPHQLDEFLWAWSEYDPAGTGYLRHYEICPLLRQLSPPLGMGEKCPKVKIYRRLVRMNMLLREDDLVSFKATFFHLVRTALNICMEHNNLRRNDDEMRAMLRRVWPHIQKHRVDILVPRRRPERKNWTLARMYTAKLLYDAYKTKREKEEGEESVA